MAVYRIFPEKDTFISTEVPTGNAGKDEIIEIGTYLDTSGVRQISRLIVQYNTSEIQDVITNKIGISNYSASIRLNLADAYELPINYSINAYPIYGTWDGGVGKFGDTPINTTGVSWKYKSAEESNAWPVSLLHPEVTASYSIVTGGGNWYTSSMGISLESVQSYVLNSIKDINIDVTPTIKLQISGALDNNGFILKLSNDIELYSSSSIRLKYYGADTNTIYPPSLEFKWDDSTYYTGSLSVLNNSISIINVTNNKGNYIDEGTQRFRLSAKPKYPVKAFSTVSPHLTNYALPSNSYWGIKDENTTEMVFDFDTNFTKISCDSIGPFFDIYMGGLEPERYYRILIKTILDGSTTIVDNKNIFKIVRNV